MTVSNQVPLTKPVTVGVRGMNSKRNRSPFDSIADQLFEESTEADVGRSKPSVTLPSLTEESLMKTQYLKRGCPKILGMAHKSR